MLTKRVQLAIPSSFLFNLVNADARLVNLSMRLDNVLTKLPVLQVHSTLVASPTTILLTHALLALL
jgi:hypothetical protein